MRRWKRKRMRNSFEKLPFVETVAFHPILIFYSNFKYEFPCFCYPKAVKFYGDSSHKKNGDSNKRKSNGPFFSTSSLSPRPFFSLLLPPPPSFFPLFASLYFPYILINRKWKILDWRLYLWASIVPPLFPSNSFFLSSPVYLCLLPTPPPVPIQKIKIEMGRKSPSGERGRFELNHAEMASSLFSFFYLFILSFFFFFEFKIVIG